MRKSEAIEEVCDNFDATSTVDLSAGGMDKLIWLLTRMRPFTKMSDLRCKTWKDFYAKLKVASKRTMKALTEDTFKSMLQELETMSDDIVDRIAQEQGFKEICSALR